MTVCCTYLCKFVVTKVLLSSTPELSKAPYPKSYAVYSLPTRQFSQKKCQYPTANCQYRTHPETSTTSIFTRREFFWKAFNVLSTKGTIPRERPFSRKVLLSADLRNNFLHFPDLSLQLKLHERKTGCGGLEVKPPKIFLVRTFQQDMVPINVATELETSFGITEATPAFARKSDFIDTQALSQLQAGQTTV